MSSSDFLFNEGDLAATVEGARRKMALEIGDLAASQLLAANVEQVCAHFSGKYKLDPIILHRDGVELIDPVEIQVERNSEFGGRFIRKELEFRFEIPFEGDPGLFRLRPSMFTLNPTRGRVENGKVIFIHRRADRDAAAIKGAFDEFLSSISQSIAGQQPQIVSWNQALPGLVQQSVTSSFERC
jgi:hypothetical protein